MNKKILLDKNAEKELREFPADVQEEFEKRFEILKVKGWLEYPEAKKITKKIYEIRVKCEGEYRSFYAYARTEYIIILHFFGKKSQKTPINNLKIAERRLRQYE